MSKTKLSLEQKNYLKTLGSKKKRKKQKKTFKLGNLIDSQFKVTITEIIPPVNLNFEPDLSQEIEKPIKQKVEVVEEFFEKLKGTGYENSFFKAVIPINTPIEDVFKAVDNFRDKKHNENQTTLTKEKLEELTNPELIEKKKDFETAIDYFLNSGKHIDLGFNANGTNDIPIGGILDIENPFKIFKEVDIEKEIPMEFCVEITEDNFIVLNKVFLDYTTRWGDIILGRFLHTNRLNSQVYYTSNNLNLNKKEVPVVSTEEFLCYIGKEKLIFPKELDYLISDKKDMENSLQKAIDRENMYLRMLKNKPKPKTYTKEDVEKCFNEARLTTHPLTASFKHENLASYLKTLSDEQ